MIEATLRLQRQVRIRIIKVINAGLRIVHVKPAGVYDDLARGVELDVRAVHRTRRGPFKINGLSIVAAAVTRTLELVFARFPLRRAAQVRTAGEHDKEAIGLLDDPNTIAHQELLVHAEIEIRGIADRENGVGFVECPRKKEPQEHKEVDAEIAADGRPDDTPAHAIRRSFSLLVGAGFGWRFCRNRWGSGGLGG